MSGPSLKKRDGHSSIHEAALHEAREITDLYTQCIRHGEEQQALSVADVLIEHWESRTLAHAQSEEEGLYVEVLEQNPEFEEAIIGLKRDHDLMRKIVHMLKERNAALKADETSCKLMEALIIIDEIHNDEEMEILPHD